MYNSFLQLLTLSIKHVNMKMIKLTRILKLKKNTHTSIEDIVYII